MPFEVLPDALAAQEKSLFPFYHQIKDGEHLALEEPNGLEAEQRSQDNDDVKYMRDYRLNSGWDRKARRGMRVYNVLQSFTPEDEISRLFLGYTRTSIDQGLNQCTEGEPDFDFEPFDPSDNLKVILWKHMIKMVLGECQYKLQQDTFFRDYFVTGCGVFEVFIDYPQRTIRVPNEAFPGGFEPIVIQDHRRPKVGIRAVNPLNCWRNPNIDSANHVPSCLRRRIITWNQMAQEFGRATDANGDPMYKNMNKLAKGSHASIYYYQDEIRDIYRIYISTFGTQSDGFITYPASDDLGICVLDKPLKIHERVVDKIVERSTGLNIPGLCSLRWGILFDKYDKNLLGDHSVYGMGLPERIEAEDTAIQGMFNQNLDNYRWASTVALNYKGSNADSYLDVDANRLYGGELIDGEITPMPLGISRITDYEAMMDVMDKSTIPATGINHNQMIGDSSKTLGEFALRIRQANRGAEQRLTKLETEVFAPVGSLLLANCFATLGEDEYESITADQVKFAKEQIKAGRETLTDYKDLNGDNPQKKFMRYVPIKGEKIREDFKVTKKRKLDYNAPLTKNGTTQNTLIRDSKMKVETSFVPLSEEYVKSSGQLPKCVVSSKRMLSDIKNQDAANVKTAIDFILQLMTTVGYKGADLDKMVGEILKFAEIDPKQILTTSNNSSPALDKTKQLLEQLQGQDQQQPPQGAPQPTGAPQQTGSPQNAGPTPADMNALGPAANNAQRLAVGTT